MDGSSRAQLWLATLGAVVALGAAAVPATWQLLDDEAVPPAEPPAVTVPVPTATPQPAAAGVETAQQRRPDQGRGVRRDRGG
jgi:hypothetical protein